MSQSNVNVAADYVVPHNASTVIIPNMYALNAEVKTLYNQAEDEVNVEMYGAIGDGTTDDTASIQEAIDNHRKVVFQRGLVYRLTEALEIPSNTEIDLNQAILIQNDGTDPYNWIIPGTGGTTPDTLPDECPGARYYNFRAMKLEGVEHVTIRNGYIYGILRGIELTEDCSDILVEDIQMDYVKVGFRITGTGFFTRIHCNRMNINNAQYCSIHIQPTETRLRDCTFSNCRLWNFGTWAMVTQLSNNIRFEHQVEEFDDTYDSFLYGGTDSATEGDYETLVPWMNKRHYDSEETEGFYATSGQYIVEHFGYMYGLDQCVFDQCYFANDRLDTHSTTASYVPALKMVNCLNCTMQNMNLTTIYNALPNSNSTDTSTYTSHFTLDGCKIQNGGTLVGYSPATKHQFDITNSEINGTLLVYGTAGYVDDNWLHISNCRWQPEEFTNGGDDPILLELNMPVSTFGGRFDVKVDNCQIYGVVDNPVFTLQATPSAMSDQTVFLHGNTFIGQSTVTEYEDTTTNVGLYISGYENNAFTAASFIVSECVFEKCNGVSCDQINNVIVDHCYFDQKLDVQNSSTRLVRYTNCYSKVDINPFTYGERGWKFTGEGDDTVTELCGNPAIIDSCSVTYPNDVIAAGLFGNMNQLDYAAGTGSVSPADSTGSAYITSERWMEYTNGMVGSFTIDNSLADLRTRGSFGIQYGVDSMAETEGYYNLMSIVSTSSESWGLAIKDYALYFRSISTSGTTSTSLGYTTSAGETTSIQVNWDTDLDIMNLYIKGTLKFTTTQVMPTDEITTLLIGEGSPAGDYSFFFNDVFLWKVPRRIKNQSYYDYTLDALRFPSLNVLSQLFVSGVVHLSSVPEYASNTTAYAAMGAGRLFRTTDGSALNLTYEE